MGNMSYCRFTNTLEDLQDCRDALDDGAADDAELNPSERRAMERLVRLCESIAHRYADSIGDAS